LNELAEKEGLPIVHVRVGFKHWGTFAQWLETRKSPDEPYITALGERFSIGPDPRLILMCEESGGAILGGDEPIQNRAGNQKIIAMREKDAFQFGLMTLCIGASLFNTGKSFAEYYCELIDAYAIQNRYFDRYDQKLYDERLTGAERATAKTEGEARRDRIMNYFNELVRKYPSSLDLDGVRNDIQNRLPKGAPALPLLKSIRPIGSGGLLEGTFMQFETLWFVIRASGTDAVLRYYINGRDKDEIQSFQESVMSMTI
jgi:phosphomannomutase